MKKILLILSFSLGVSSIQAQVVSDPGAHGHMLTSIGIMGDVAKHTLNMQSRMEKLNDGIGMALGPLKSLQQLAHFGLMIAGGCDDPFAQLKGYFLGLGKFNGKIDFCSLLESQAAYRALLFLPQGQWGTPLSRARMRELDQNRQQMIQESVSNTLGVAALQKNQVLNSRKTIQQLRSEFMEKSKNLRDDMRYNTLLLSVIAEELTNIRLLLIQQSELQASTASEQVRFPVM